MNLTQPVHDGIIFGCRSHVQAAGHDDDVGLGNLIKGFGGLHGKATGVVGDIARHLGDEEHVETWDTDEGLKGSHNVERGDSGVEHQGDGCHWDILI